MKCNMNNSLAQYSIFWGLETLSKLFFLNNVFYGIGLEKPIFKRQVNRHFLYYFFLTIFECFALKYQIQQACCRGWFYRLGH